MLSSQVKAEIQAAYSQFLKNNQLKPRYGQKLMIAEIAKTLGNIELDGEGVRVSGQHIAVVEAGTGTGKTVAYLLATLPIAKALNKKVVLSTATIALQEQIVLKDLPQVIEHSGLNFSFRLAKGRGRYLCLSKLDQVMHQDDGMLIPLYEDEQGVVSEDDTRLYQDMMTRLSEGAWDGDRDSWDDEIQAESWQRVTTDHRQCTGRKCSHVRSCAFFKARESLEEADCIVANHDLVLADLALGGGAILSPPEETLYVFDEGHHLPEKALNHFASHSRYRSTIRWLGQSEGQWPGLIEPLADATYFQSLATPLAAQLKACRSVLELHLPMIHSVMQVVDRDQLSPRHRFEKGVVPEGLESIAQQVLDVFQDVNLQLEKLVKELDTLLQEDYPVVPKVDLEALYPVLGVWQSRAEASVELWRSYSHTEVDEKWPMARWITLITFNEAEDYELVSSPILAARTLERDLWSRCFGSVITSATLTALNTFDRFKANMGTWDNASYAVVPSPFNFGENTTLSVPADAVEANKVEEHTQYLIDQLPMLLAREKGSLVLFSSRRQMQAVYEALPKEESALILMQGNESKQLLVKTHKQRIDDGKRSVIFGLASFAEGVDLPGAYCSHVLIAKIPFTVPDDPLAAALAEWVEARGGNPFMQLTVPDASMKLIQACGRLMRRETDRGEITILDKRLKTKRYGKALIDALPPFGQKV